MLNDEAALSNAMILNYKRLNPYLCNRPILNISHSVNVKLGLMLFEVASYDEDTNIAQFSLGEFMVKNADSTLSFSFFSHFYYFFAWSAFLYTCNKLVQLK